MTRFLMGFLWNDCIWKVDRCICTNQRESLPELFLDWACGFSCAFRNFQAPEHQNSCIWQMANFQNHIFLRQCETNSFCSFLSKVQQSTRKELWMFSEWRCRCVQVMILLCHVPGFGRRTARLRRENTKIWVRNWDSKEKCECKIACDAKQEGKWCRNRGCMWWHHALIACFHKIHRPRQATL